MMRLLCHLAGVHVWVVSILMKKKKPGRKTRNQPLDLWMVFFFPLLAFDVLGFADLWLISRNKTCLFWLMLVDQVRSNLHYLSFASDHIEELILIKNALDHQFSWTESPEEKLSTTFRTLMAFFSLLGFDLWRFADLWLIDITSTKLVCFFLMLVDKVRSQSTWSEFCFRS